MQSLDAARIVALWEQQAHHHGFERTLGLLEAACPELSDDERLSLTVGECHRALLRMRAQTFGDTLSASIDCPGCGVELELALSVEQLCAA
ncbi:MAG: hypothetical protein K0V04_27710 [Deltaproteobacteria bacterium]|nr:hypothetical protein [Deltaproteobacteria bacterium]